VSVRPRLCFLTLALLTLATTHLGAQTVTAPDSDNMIPNRYIVVYRNAVPGDAETRTVLAGARLLQRHDRIGIATVQTPTRASSLATARLAQQAAEDDQATMRRLAAQPNVDYVFHDRIVTAHRLHVRPIPESLDPTFSVVTGPTATYDTYYNSPQGWAVRLAGGYGNSVPGGSAGGPWNTTTGKGVRIAILDSGIDPAHPDVSPNLALNLSEVDPSVLPSICDDGSPRDQDGHGTWTASLAAAALGPGTGRLIGVAPSATLLNIKVLQRMPLTIPGANETARCTAGGASGLLSWVIQGIDDAIANHADVISMSLGATIDLSTGDGAGVKAAFDRVTYAATQAGAVVVAAAGNDGYDLSNSRYIEIPAQSRGVLAVAASTNPDCMENTTSGAACLPGSPSLAYYSNRGAPLNALAAPGGSYPSGSDMAISGWVRGACSSGIPSTADGLPTDSSHSFGCFELGHTAYVQAIGTSASAPLVAGAVALLRSAHPDWDPTRIINALRSTATPPTSTLPVPEINTAGALNQP
jgi:Subtilisin-like serine proteases